MPASLNVLPQLRPWVRRLAAGALAAGSVVAASAQALPQSSACRTALEALGQAEDALLDAHLARAASAPDTDRQRAVAARLLPLRQRVADACLGGLTTSPPPSQRSWNPPAPARPGATPPRTRPSALPPPAAAPRVETPVIISHCNGATCLGSDGSTLTRVGPNLVGPRGVCTQQGIFLRCP